ncbi:MAG: hypothetical protein KJN93_00370, partial [Alphaproteobacteria bacterium]|nr:hypothetical protein [Alphaproteobacteria bacterium]
MSDTSRYSKRRSRRTTERPDVEDILKSMNWETRLAEARKKRPAVLARRAADTKTAATAAPALDASAGIPAATPPQTDAVVTEETRLVPDAGATPGAALEQAAAGPAITRVVTKPAAPRGARAYFGLGAGIGLGLAAGLAIASFVNFRSQPSLPQAVLDTGPGPIALSEPIDPPVLARAEVPPATLVAVAGLQASDAPGAVAPAAVPDELPGPVDAVASLPQIEAEPVPANTLQTSLIPRPRPQNKIAVAELQNEGATAPEPGSEDGAEIALGSEAPAALPQVIPAIADPPQPSATFVAAKWVSVPDTGSE